MMWNGYGGSFGMWMMLFSFLVFPALLITGGYLAYRAVRYTKGENGRGQ